MWPLTDQLKQSQYRQTGGAFETNQPSHFSCSSLSHADKSGFPMSAVQMFLKAAAKKTTCVFNLHD